jgi:hypothetical protein
MNADTEKPAAKQAAFIGLRRAADPKAALRAARMAAYGNISYYGSYRDPADATRLPEGTDVWVFTKDPADIALPRDEFVFVADCAGGKAALEAKFPAGAPGLYRVEVARNTLGPDPAKPSESWRRDVVVETTAFLVHTVPVVSCATLPCKPNQTVAAAIVDLITSHGPVLFPRDAANGRAIEGFGDSHLVAVTSPYCNYVTLKASASKAQARRTRQQSKAEYTAKENAKTQAEEALVDAIAGLRDAILVDLWATGLVPALHTGQGYSSGLTCNAEPEMFVPGRGGVGKYSRTVYRHQDGRHLRAVPQITPLDRLRVLCVIHAKFRGKNAWRRLQAWRDLRAAYKALPPGVSPAQWGILDPAGATASWWAAEMAARTVSLRKEKTESCPEPKPNRKRASACTRSRTTSTASNTAR